MSNEKQPLTVEQFCALSSTMRLSALREGRFVLANLNAQERIAAAKQVKDVTVRFDAVKSTITRIAGDDSSQICTTGYRMAETLTPAAKTLTQEQIVDICCIFKLSGVTPQGIITQWLIENGVDWAKVANSKKSIEI